MRKRRLKAFNQDLPEHQMWAKVTINIAAYFRQKLHFISPQGIVFILYEFAKLGLYPGTLPSCFRGAINLSSSLRATLRVKSEAGASFKQAAGSESM